MTTGVVTERVLTLCYRQLLYVKKAKELKYGGWRGWNKGETKRRKNRMQAIKREKNKFYRVCRSLWTLLGDWIGLNTQNVVSTQRSTYTQMSSNWGLLATGRLPSATGAIFINARTRRRVSEQKDGIERQKSTRRKTEGLGRRGTLFGKCARKVEKQ